MYFLHHNDKEVLFKANYYLKNFLILLVGNLSFILERCHYRQNILLHYIYPWTNSKLLLGINQAIHSQIEVFPYPCRRIIQEVTLYLLFQKPLNIFLIILIHHKYFKVDVLYQKVHPLISLITFWDQYFPFLYH